LRKLDSLHEYKYHRQEVAAVVASLKVDAARGLTTAEAAKRLQGYGPNELDAEEEESLWEKIKEQFEDLLARILLMAATISFIIAVTGDGEEGIAAYVEPFVILLILILNAMVAIYQDYDADSALDALKGMQAAECRCLRDGAWASIAAANLVPGDIVEVKMGECVPADVRLVEMRSISLLVEEAPLTGEAVSVAKQIEPVDGEILQE
jgi:magnesium-transporting ATPase (P-type)